MNGVTNIIKALWEAMTRTPSAEELAMRELDQANTEALAQPEQEPVAVVDANDDGYWADILPDRSVKVGQLLYTHAQPTQPEAEKQEPVAWMCHPFGDDEVEYGPHKECENCIPLYTTPPQRTAAVGEDSRAWVGLTDEEIMEIGRELGVKCRLGGNKNIDFDYARAIEAATRAYILRT